MGGTHYYTQSLLFQDALANEPTLDLKEKDEKFPILEESTEVILAKLKAVDPVMADRWHPNERRKIQRSLEIFLRTGKPASQVYSEQRLSRGLAEDTLGSDHASLRFPTLVIWVYANKEALTPRLDGRIHKMIDRGLLSEVQELTSFRKSHEARTGATLDQTRGIWVSIGYKEFLEYQDIAADGSCPEEQGEKLKTIAIEKMQAASRQYANRQVKWIRIKLLNALINAGEERKTFLVDGSDLSRWDDDVIKPALNISAQFLAGTTLPAPSFLSAAAAEMLKPKRDYDLSQRPDLWEKKVCETCGTVAVTENDWSLHIKSRAHRRAVGAEKKQSHTRQVSEKNLKAAQEDVVDVLEDYLQAFSPAREDEQK